MRKLLTFASLSLCAMTLALVAMPTPSAAKPPTAATADSGTGCLVADANGSYTADPACEWHIVNRRGSDGARVLVSYHDHGNLPAGAPRPSSARRNAVSFTFGDGTVCEGNEVTTPSGEYRSDCRFNAGN